MYLVAIAWIYVVLMMSAAEATASNGTLLGALVTFVLYGLLPVSIVIYLMRTPARKRARARAEQALQVQEVAQQPNVAQPASAEGPRQTPP